MKTEKEINIEKELFPESNVLIDNYRMQIVDAELDPVDCMFNGDGCVTINTDGLQWVTLSVENLQSLMDAIEEVDTKNNN
jgi:hypothetical protein